ncbi:Glycyl-tRNA synthetase beta chain [hydrothermal vent metagenome]|uniref:glycine--tRNA ligase n=1 Tax=hydrothermal vent metagenome TaxID=652676 RepID=A0A3B0YTC9_9ZZZZ
MSVEDFFVEIGTEELPPKALKKLSASFTDNISKQFVEAKLKFDSIKSFATPRRLAVFFTSLEMSQSDKSIEKKGPAISAAFDKEGNPTKAVLGFARSCGIEVSELQKIETEKGAWVSYTLKQKGKQTAELIPDIIRTALEKLPIAKRMRWGALDFEFVRPVHWVTILLGKEIVPANIYGIQSDRKSRGHRFHHHQNIELSHGSEYEKELFKAKVIVDFSTRMELVKNQVEEKAKDIGGTAVIDIALLEEVTSMVEWPFSVAGNFEKKFLAIPSEALISAMKQHQKYFHLINEKGDLLPAFITVCNIESTNPASVKAGNEKVIRPRLADSMFFWNKDKKNPLDNKLTSLKNVVFQKKLGSLFDKTMRVKCLAGNIASFLGANTTYINRAAELCKCDLMTEMVGEFPDLQGTMGRYYATHNNEPNEVCLALEQYYQPRFSGDEIPQQVTGQCLALADKLDTIVGIFGIGLAPTGDKDPFALRRSVLGCIRILIEGNLQLDLLKILKAAIEAYNKQAPKLLGDKTLQKVYEFMLARLPVYYTSQGIQSDSVESVICLNPTYLNDSDKRIHAVNKFRTLPQAESLAETNKRISNIIKKAPDFKLGKINTKLLVEESEIKLAAKVEESNRKLKPLFQEKKYEEAMSTLAELRDSIDYFFDSVMVMDKDSKIRNNRLALLASLRNQFLQIADISKLQS